jgi:hypothetical protein
MTAATMEIPLATPVETTAEPAPAKPKAKSGKGKKAKAAKVTKKDKAPKPSTNGHGGGGHRHEVKTGTVLTREYKGRHLTLKAVEGGFKMDGKTFASLTAAAKAATGYPSIAGTVFWGVK